MCNGNEPNHRDEMLERLDEILFWLRVSSFPAARKLFEDVLNSKDKRYAYQLTDGRNTMADIEKKVGVAHSTLQAWWSEWKAKGIVREAPQRKGRKQRLVDLRTLDLD